ncbi:hypothetical protein [Vibrio neonatus]|uniref:hypothetical protein n=1 Tax=Vibrio neonatus TaxID=278860 RepID=UPI0021C3C7D1|nr:hypothetical protein [Vibrio neonatus]
MSINKEWFEQRDRFITKQKEQGCFALEEALEKLDATLPYFYDLGILTQREFTTTTTNFIQLTALGGLFFVEHCQQIFINPENFNRLKQALGNWDHFTIDYPLYQSDIMGKISIRNQTHVDFKVKARLFRHKLKFRIEDTRNEIDIFISSDGSNQLLNVWNDFSQCVAFIENEDKSPINIAIATDINAIESLCAPWHTLVQRYFRNTMHELAFEHNLSELKRKIESKYSISSSEWSDIDRSFDLIRPARQCQFDEPQPSSSEEVKIQRITHQSINKFGLVKLNQIETTHRKAQQIQRYCPVNPGDVLLYKSADRKTVKVAYYSIEDQHEHLCSELFTVIRAKGNGHWDGKRLFLFLTSLAGQTLLEYSFRDFSVNKLAQIRLTPRQIYKLQIPQLDLYHASELDNKYVQLNKLLQQQSNIEKQIATLIQ